VFAQQPPAQQGQRGGGQQQAQSIQQLKPGFYVVTGAGGNSSVRVTNEGVILVDTKNLGEPFYNALMDQIKTATNQPVKHVLVTHVHQDHSGNIGPFVKAGAQVITHEGLKRNLETGGPDGKGYTSQAGKPATPNFTYQKEHVVRLGGAEARAYHFANGHTGGDTVVYFPDVRVVALGDEFVHPQAPNCDYPMGGSLLGWKRSLDEVAKLDFDTAIPGHGTPVSKAEFLAYRTKFNTLVDRAVQAVKKGVPKDQLLAQIKTDDIGWNINTQQWQNPQRLDAMYEELSKAK
jgi:glyoxylase-like metal-dependent hydrolase (beta-lactamase superfamily II)